MNLIKFHPLDILFFRDGKPFNAGENVEGTTRYPLPTVFYGAMRTALMNGDISGFYSGKYEDFIGTPTTHGTFNCWGPFVFEKDRLLFPIPLNVSTVDKKEFKVLLPTKNFEEHEFKIANGLTVKLHHLWLKTDEEIEKPKSKFFDLDNLFNYLSGEELKFEEEREKEFAYVVENRMGIRVDRETKKAQDKMIYRISTYRFKNESGFFVFSNESEKLKEVKTVFLGGKKHLATVEVEKFNKTFPKIVGKKFFLYLTTPAIFENGLLPSSFDGEKVTINGHKCKLVSIANGKPVSVTSFDMAQNKSRAVYKAVPSGSVYFFESDVEMEFDGFVDFTDKMKEYGFGKALVGGWDYV